MSGSCGRGSKNQKKYLKRLLNAISCILLHPLLTRKLIEGLERKDTLVKILFMRELIRYAGKISPFFRE